MKRLLLAYLLFLTAFAYSELNLYADLDYGHSNLILEHKVTVDESGFFIPEFNQRVWTSPYFEVLSVRRDDIVDMKYTVSGNYLTYTTRESIEYGEWYNTIITLKPRGNNPVIYGEYAYYFNPLIGSRVDNYTIEVPEGWTYQYNISNEKNQAEVLIYQLPRTFRFVSYNYSEYSLFFSEYENNIVRVSDDFWRGYKQLADYFLTPLTEMQITSMPPENFEENVLAHFKLDAKVIEYNIDLSARAEKESTQTLLHEVVHALVDKKFEKGITCNWFSEGLPEYLSYTVAPDKYNYSDDISIMQDNFDKCFCEEWRCLDCDEGRINYDWGYLLLDAVSETCNFEACVGSYLSGPTCYDAAKTLAFCCGDLSGTLEEFGATEYTGNQNYLHSIYQQSENCSNLGLKSFEVQAAMKKALDSENIDFVSEVPRLCSEFIEVEKLADTTEKQKFLEENTGTRGPDYLRSRFLVYDRYLELKQRASNLRCFNKTVLDYDVLSVMDALNTTIETHESRELDFGTTLGSIVTTTNNEGILNQSKTAWKVCDLEELNKLEKQALKCEKIKKWGFLFPIINFFMRSCL